MSTPEKHYTRQELLAALDQGWKQYLSQLAALSADEQARYVQGQGYVRVQDVLAHIFAWWERSMQRSRMVLQGRLPTDPEVEALFVQTINEFNDAAIRHYQGWDLTAIKEHFAATLAELEQFLRELPDAALENEMLQRWMRSEAIDHYEEHRLSDAPSVR